MERRNDLTAEYVRAILAYDPATGEFRWKVYRANRRMKPGDLAGSQGHKGYWTIYIDGKPYLDKGNNRWTNLRPATVQQNSHNKALRKDSTSGTRGVSWHNRERKWQAYISDPATKRRKYLGMFKDKEAAVAVRTEAETALFGEFRYAKAS